MIERTSNVSSKTGNRNLIIFVPASITPTCFLGKQKRKNLKTSGGGKNKGRTLRKTVPLNETSFLVLLTTLRSGFLTSQPSYPQNITVNVKCFAPNVYRILAAN